MRRSLPRLNQPRRASSPALSHLHAASSSRSRLASTVPIPSSPGSSFRDLVPPPSQYGRREQLDETSEVDQEAKLSSTRRAEILDDLGHTGTASEAIPSRWFESDQFDTVSDQFMHVPSKSPPPPSTTPSPPVPSRTARPSKPQAPKEVAKRRTKVQPLADLPHIDSPIQPYRPPVYTRSDEQVQPEHAPLVSRYDWRLSSPLRPSPREYREGEPLTPPRLNVVKDTTRQGFNKLVGVGPDPLTEARRRTAVESESWGWKSKVPDTEKGEWSSCDEYRKKLDELIALSQAADELNYLYLLRRRGTPVEREARGEAVLGVRGRWLGEFADPQKVEEAMRKSGLREGAGSKTEEGKTVSSRWHRIDHGAINEENCCFVEGTVLRFTRFNVDEPTTSSRPQVPEDSNSKSIIKGTLLEMKDGDLIVGFEEDDVWPMEDDIYKIDFGLDDAVYRLQKAAIENLYYDPARQQRRNAEQVASAQRCHLAGKAATVREWAMQGTSLREIIVPDLDEGVRTANSDEKTGGELDGHVMPSFPPAEERVGTRSWNPVPLHPSDVFGKNLLIKSWIIRHSREVPMGMPGDPDLGLNESQTRAIAMALAEKLSLIQGPPGTGKSQTLVTMIKLLKSHFRIPQPILLVAPTHVAADHLLKLLIKAGLNPMRLGKARRVSEEYRSWTVEQRRVEHPLWDRTESSRLASEVARQALDDHRASGPSNGLAYDEEAERLETAYRVAWRRFFTLEQRLYSSLLSTADVFVGTAHGSGSTKIMNLVDFPIVFLDEAAVCTEPVTLIPLMKGAVHATLIGDHKQLPAVTSSREAIDKRLHESLFERLMRSKTVKSVLLQTQYRMRPEISAFPNQAFYQAALRDSTCVASRPDRPLTTYKSRSNDCATVFITHKLPESLHDRSWCNVGEVDIVVEIIGDLLRRNPGMQTGSIGVISPYKTQVRRIRQALYYQAKQRFGDSLSDERLADLVGIEVHTVDGFQGREKDVIILSTVRSNPDGTIGFLTDTRRLNVSLTRARDLLFVVGNPATLRHAASRGSITPNKDSDPTIWRKYLQWMEAKGAVIEWKK